LASTVEHVVASGVPFVFTDGHPVVEPKAFYNNVANINQVDLALMARRDWYDTNADPDRKRRRQAEFLVHKRFALELVLAVGVRTDAMQQWVCQVMSNTPYKPPCIVRPAWYYKDWE
jgi:ssDNA thymidine ADP-ribosyltransferase DarT-like protein